MKDICLILNNREEIPPTKLAHLESRSEIRWYQRDAQSFSLDEAISSNPDVTVLVTCLLDLPGVRLARWRNLRAIVATTVAIDYIDIEFCKAHGITVCNTPSYTGSTVAEYAFALALASARNLPQLESLAQTSDVKNLGSPGTELWRKHVGILGLGHIGSLVAKYAKCFNMDVTYYNRSSKSSDVGSQVDLDTLLRQCNFLFVTLPLNSQSRHLLDARKLSLLRDSSIIVSISPDEIIDLNVLASELRCRRLYAALDLHKPHPELIGLPNLLITIRRAWYTKECFERRIALWTRTLERILEGTPGNALDAV